MKIRSGFYNLSIRILRIISGLLTTRKIFAIFFLSSFFVYTKAQKDSIDIQIKLDEVNYIAHVQQKIVYRNHLSRSVDSIKLMAWANAYKNSKTPLGKRKLQERKTALYFANKEKLGYIKNFKIDTSSILSYSDPSRENIYLHLKRPLREHEHITLNLEYDIHIPSSEFTEYGFGNNRILLKYFFIVPDGFENNKLSKRHYLDLSENQSIHNYWNIRFENGDYHVQSNLLQKSPSHFEGVLYEDPEILISYTENNPLNFDIEGQKILLDLGYKVSLEEEANLAFILPLQLKFIKNKIGFLPHKIFLSDYAKNKNAFIGSEDIQFHKWKFSLFTEAEKTDLNYFSMLSQYIINQSFLADKNTNHWIYNGLKTYLEIEYLKKYYADKKLLGNLPNEVKFWKIKPLKWFNASDIKLTDRYGLAYEYILRHNLDQKINAPLQSLSKFNTIAISSFETGLIFSMLNDKTQRFDSFITQFLSQNRGKKVDFKYFLQRLQMYSQDTSLFLEKFIQHKNRVNFKLSSFKKTDDNQLSLKISKNSLLKIPFKVESESFSGKLTSFWFDTTASTKKHFYKIPDDSTKVVFLNNHYTFPEANFGDNYLYTKGMFSNMKKIRFKLFTDIPNPKYHEIYASPKLSWNNYDKFLLGTKFTNESLIEPKFIYSLEPSYSTGTGRLTGSIGASYQFMPPESFFRRWVIGANAAYYHYDYNLPYKKVNFFTQLNFAKNPRSQISRNLMFSYSYFERELSPLLIKQNDYAKYNLWNIGYSYSDSKAIHENSLTSNFQWMEDFQKLSAEYYYRWEYAKNKKLMLRSFAGVFINNTTKNNLFNFGLSKVSNYAFSYGLLGQSATTGILSQQFILAEGGFKSDFKDYVNRWMVSTNIDTHIWKMFGIYVDAGLYKNKQQPVKFIWDSGINLKVIPDFLEIYFPIQSSLGFEPSFKGYGSRIRYTLNINLGAIIGYFRRGVY
ncbi:aminopeptidase [Elizabethkingia argentiflava]|uniref:Aminopeptidase n=1 Tax=Elizabethkingia argenteiflava TaxID=2681556 RepID=A0A845PYJ9_9FLAO|nr:M1 family metallopeptidase [Elizabethkingia argenteiflava]NAW51438.1 aminopeptidase [Elizabethkingia argenteiflava]